MNTNRVIMAAFVSLALVLGVSMAKADDTMVAQAEQAPVIEEIVTAKPSTLQLYKDKALNFCRKHTSFICPAQEVAVEPVAKGPTPIVTIEEVPSNPDL